MRVLSPPWRRAHANLAQRACTTSAAHREPAQAPSAYSKKHVALLFGFLGTNYHGLQTQCADGVPGQPTVSDQLRRALLASGAIADSNWAPLERTKWRLASRTDKGVHAALAAVSLRMETLEHMLETPRDDSDYIERWDAAASDAKVGAADLADARSTALERPHLTAAEVARINALLPPDVVLHGGLVVRKSFTPRESASHREYEYLLPVEALGAGGVEALDSALRLFEGTHRFHNFCSGLRHKEEKVGHFSHAELLGDSISWPLALPIDSNDPAPYRTVLSCRVHRTLDVNGEPYAVVRIAGFSFVLHQIRHMVGSALAIVHNIVPRKAVEVALSSPLLLNVSPLAPGKGLLLNRIGWFDVHKGVSEFVLSRDIEERAEVFKLEHVYPHIQKLYSDGSMGAFVARMQSESTRGRHHYTAEDYERLERVDEALKVHMAALAAKSREEREARRLGRASVDSSDAPRELKSGAEERKMRPQLKPQLPGGCFAQICVRRQILPGKESFEQLVWLRERVEAGALPMNQPYEFYLNALDEAGPWPTVGSEKS